jgi:uncharacterized protein (DUF3084 family)
MLDKEEIKKITELIEHGKTNYRIGKELNHSANTINDIRVANKKSEGRQTQGEDVGFNSPLDKIQGIIADFDTLIQTKQLNDRDRKEWEKRTEKLKEILRVEVDDRIAKERADAVEKRDQEWNKFLEQSYVKKEVATNLESTIQERDATILNLTKTIGEKDEEILKNQSNISKLTRYIQQKENQTQDLVNENKVLKDENWELNSYIKNRLDDTVGRDLEQLRYERNVLNAEKTCFAKYKEDQQSILNTLFTESEERRKAAEMREKHLAEWEEKIQKREDELYTTRNTMYDALHKCINTVKMGFDKQKEEINQEKKKITNQQEQITKEREALKKTAEEQKTEADRLQKLKILLEITQEKQNCIIVHPEPCSGVPVIQSGFSH